MFKEFGWTGDEVTMCGYDWFEVDGIMRSYRRELTDDTGPSSSLAIVLGEPVNGLGPPSSHGMPLSALRFTAAGRPG